jgi:hypothetical protein
MGTALSTFFMGALCHTEAECVTALTGAGVAANALETANRDTKETTTAETLIDMVFLLEKNEN